MTVRVMLIDDHPIVLSGLSSALAGRTDLEVVAQARTLAEARRILDAESIDVALLDLRMPDGSGTDLLDDARGFAAPPAFVVLSTFMTPQYVDAAIALGASGFLLKTAPIDEIVATVLLVAGGRLAFSVDQLRASRRIGWAPLTKREHAVIEGVIAGDSNDELSASLGVSRKTVEAYLSRLFARFGVLTRTELAVRAEREHWLELPIERRDPRVERRSPRQ